MTGIPNLVRWNANFVRGLAQSVLERARVIRATLTTSTPPPQQRKAKKTVRRAAPGRRNIRSRRKANG